MSRDEAVDRLRKTLPAIELAAGLAKIHEPEGEIFLAIISKKEDGSGQISATFNGDAFIADLKEALMSDG